MTLNRYAKRRDENEPPIVKALRKAGVKVWYLDRPLDLLTGYKKEFRFLEVKKDSKEDFTDDQAEFFEDTIGYPRYRVVSIEDALRVHGLL
jgi:hypothetical protein